MAGMVADLPIECSVALQTYQQMLDVLHQKVSKVTLESRHLRGESSVELTTFDLSASLQKANVHLADRLNCLRGKEVEIARFSRQVCGVLVLCSVAICHLARVIGSSRMLSFCMLEIVASIHCLLQCHRFTACFSVIDSLPSSVSI
jgi:hypothetical protein